jgi:hypothetical protein
VKQSDPYASICYTVAPDRAVRPDPQKSAPTSDFSTVSALFAIFL